MPITIEEMEKGKTVKRNRKRERLVMEYIKKHACPYDSHKRIKKEVERKRR